jgi:hypothetical protein
MPQHNNPKLEGLEHDDQHMTASRFGDPYPQELSDEAQRQIFGSTKQQRAKVLSSLGEKSMNFYDNMREQYQPMRPE